MFLFCIQRNQTFLSPIPYLLTYVNKLNKDLFDLAAIKIDIQRQCLSAILITQMNLLNVLPMQKVLFLYRKAIIKINLFFIFSIATFQILFGQAPKWSDLKLFAGYGFDNSSDIKVDRNNNYYLACNLSNTKKIGIDSIFIDCSRAVIPFNSTKNGFLLRYDSTKKLNLVIENPIGFINSVNLDTSGNIYVTGSHNYGASSDAFLTKYSSSGLVLWTKIIRSFSLSGYNADDVITSMDVLKDGTICISGFSYGQSVSFLGNMVTGPVSFVSKITTDGNVVWINSFSSTLGFGAYRVKFDNNKNIVIGGNETDNMNNYWAVIAKVDGLFGNFIWKKRFKTAGSFISSIGILTDSYAFGGLFGIQINFNGNVITSQGNQDIFLLRSDTSGNIQWVKSWGSNERDELNGMFVDANENIIFTGGYSNNFSFNGTVIQSKGNIDVFIAAVDKLGNPLWIKNGGSKTFSSEPYFTQEYGRNLVIDSKNQIQVIGDIVGSGTFGPLLYYSSENSNRNIFWLTLGERDSSKTVNDPCYNPYFKLGSPIKIYPNPFTDKLKIVIPDDVIGYSGVGLTKYTFTIYNTIGQPLKKYNYKVFGSSIIEINGLGVLPKGVYILRIDTYKKTQSLKLIKE